MFWQLHNDFDGVLHRQILDVNLENIFSSLQVWQWDLFVRNPNPYMDNSVKPSGTKKCCIYSIKTIGCTLWFRLSERHTITKIPAASGSIPSISFRNVERIRSCTTSLLLGPDAPPPPPETPSMEFPSDLAPTRASNSSKNKMHGTDVRACLKMFLTSFSDSPT